MGGPTWGMLPLTIFHVPFFCSGKKWLEAIWRVDMWHIFEPKSHPSIAISVRLLIAMTMEIWDPEFGPFQPIFGCFCHFRPSWEHHISMGQGT